MLVVTHEMGFARRVAHRIVFMDEGSVVERSRVPISFLTNLAMNVPGGFLATSGSFITASAAP